MKNSLITNQDLKKRLGTNFYNIALHTNGGVLLHPGNLVRAMIDTLPENVILYENSSLLGWERINGKINVGLIMDQLKPQKYLPLMDFKSLALKQIIISQLP